MASYPVLENGMASPHHIHVDFNTTGFGQGGGLTVGQRGSLRDGRVFYWTKNGTTTALTRAELLVTADSTANHVDQTVNAAGDFTIGLNTVTLNPAGTTIILEEYTEGYVFINDDTGEGFMYKIKAHAGNAGSTQSEATIYEEVVVSTGSGAEHSLMRNYNMNPQQSNLDGRDVSIGVPNATIAAATTIATTTVGVEAASYGWVQSWGPCVVLMESTTIEPTFGSAVKIGDANGAVSGLADGEADGASGDNVIGVNWHDVTGAAGDTEFWAIDLRIRP